MHVYVCERVCFCVSIFCNFHINSIVSLGSSCIYIYLSLSQYKARYVLFIVYVYCVCLCLCIRVCCDTPLLCLRILYDYYTVFFLRLLSSGSFFHSAFISIRVFVFSLFSPFHILIMCLSVTHTCTHNEIII